MCACGRCGAGAHGDGQDAHPPRTRIAPCMWYGMVLWHTVASSTRMDAVMPRAAQFAAGTQVFVCARTFWPEVLLTDMGVLPARNMCRLADT